MNIEVEIDEKFLKSCGTGSLTGIMMNKAGDMTKLTDVKKLTLVFQRTYAYDTYTVPKYVLPCLLEAVFSIQRNGIEVEMKWSG